MTTRSCPAVLLAVAISAAGCARQVHPIGQGRAYEPDEREQRLWETSRAASSQYQSSGAMYDDPELHTYVNTVMGRLLADRGETYYLPLRPRVFILDSPSVNAFAFAHGDIFVHTGVLGRLRNEAQLAMLLGHEITHATHRHMYQELEHVYEATAHHGYIAVLSSLGGSEIQGLIDGLGRLLTLAAISGYSRDDEAESDRVGLTLLARAGYDVRQGEEMFRRMVEAATSEDRSWNFFYSDHPKLVQRLQTCRDLVSAMPAELLENARDVGEDRYLKYAIDLIREEVERHIVQGKYKLAEESLEFLAEADPQDAGPHAYLGELCRSRAGEGDAARARTAYEKALELSPNHRITLRGLGLLCLKLGEKKDAERYLNAYLSNAPDALDAEYFRQTLERLGRK